MVGHPEETSIMTQEEKQLLIKDLCARLPYGVIIDAGPQIRVLSGEDFDFYSECNNPVCTPYLRPMFSMSDEEMEEFRTLIFPKASCAYEDCLEWDVQIVGGGYLQIYVEDFSNVMDWLNAHHFDYRGLINKGLALEASEGMYGN